MLSQFGALLLLLSNCVTWFAVDLVPVEIRVENVERQRCHLSANEQNVMDDSVESG